MIIYPGNTSSIHLDNISFTAVSATNQSQEITDEMRLIQAVLMSCMICITGTGNALVILGFIVNKNLRTPSNYFLLNLAIGDFLTGTFSLPLYLKNFIISGTWVFGKHVCKLWLTIDYTLCQCTIYNIVLISCDRFLAVTKAVKYRDQQKKIKLAFMKMAAVWIVAFLIFGPAIIFWEYIVGYSVIPDGECNPEFYYSSRYLLYSSIFDFFAPMTAIAFFNLSIYFNIRSRMKNKNQNSSVNVRNIIKDDIFLVESALNSNHVGAPTQKSPKHPSRKKQIRIIRLVCTSCKVNPGKYTEKRGDVPAEYVRPMSYDPAKNAALSKDKKIAKSLAVLVGTFCICWAPYSLITIIKEGFCSWCISQILYDVTCWLFFLNSLINPFLYPLCHPAFKKTLLQLLCIDKSSKK
ncbi:histamine H3 receptor [Xenopus laevis]|uniref:Histamine H3 receptor n=2 Tax=Xenopus laevis TaxID=8355 RepID=A0A1L8FYT7_XENLA|nr:histamine H3 receptor [Xenopus laevis]OCT76737.1 hypothetical protein XELAEV_18031938mg [Xenopus laevis]